jgi:hypothetical protein
MLPAVIERSCREARRREDFLWTIPYKDNQTTATTKKLNDDVIRRYFGVCVLHWIERLSDPVTVTGSASD